MPTSSSYFPPGVTLAYDRVPRKAIRPRPVPEELYVIEGSSSCNITGSTKKRKVADRLIAYRVPDLNVVEIEVSSSCGTTGSLPSPTLRSTKKRKVADRQIAYRVPDLNVAEIEVSSSCGTTGSLADRQIAYRVPDLNVGAIEDDDAVSVGSNSLGGDEGSMLCHREELDQYRSLMRYICESLGVTLSEHNEVVA